LIKIPDQVRQAILSHASNCAPEECCGLIATDSTGRIRFAYPLTNADRSAVSFTIDPTESYHAFLHADSLGWEIAGDFHSHPNGPEKLSQRDLELAVDPSWFHLLIGPDALKAFRIANGAPREEQIT
jgi:[CysO sulfur-carrier protein]-S-L-cysteine hydrolase